MSIEPDLTDIVAEQYDAGVRRGEQIARDMIALRFGPDLGMVVVGLAMVMEDMVAPFIAGGRLVRLLEDWSPPLSGYHLYYPNRRHPSPAFAALLEEPRANSHIHSND
jgi:DNA-binding transcriptional LysR family regulator